MGLINGPLLTLHVLSKEKSHFLTLMFDYIYSTKHPRHVIVGLSTENQ